MPPPLVPGVQNRGSASRRRATRRRRRPRVEGFADAPPRPPRRERRLRARRAPPERAARARLREPRACDPPGEPQDGGQRDALARDARFAAGLDGAGEAFKGQSLSDHPVPLRHELAFDAALTRRRPDAQTERRHGPPRASLEQFRRAPRQRAVLQHFQLPRVNRARRERLRARARDAARRLLARVALAALRRLQALAPLPRLGLEAQKRHAVRAVVPEKGAPEPGPGSATTTPRDVEPPPRPSFCLAAPLGGVAGRAPPRGWGDAGGVGLCVCAASSMSALGGVEETGAGDPAACSASRRRARMASSCAESATMAPSLARAGACDASFFRSNARGASGDATRSATGVAASVARVAGERVSTLGRDDDAPRDAFVPSDVSADPVLGSRPEGLRGGVPAAELGRPRRGDP